MKWFFAFGEGSPAFEEYSAMIKVAAHTAKRFTRLEPVFMYDGRPCELTEWLKGHGVTVVHRRWKLIAEYERVVKETGLAHHASYASAMFLRTEIPRLCEEQGWTDEEVLYTDCDIMFAGDPEPLLPDLWGAFVGLAPEMDPADPDNVNSGVMAMRLPALRTVDEAFERFIVKNMAECADYGDQFAYKTFFRHGWKPMAPELNWKPYWGENPDARIIHFHSPKPFVRPALASGAASLTQRQLARGAFVRYCEIWDEALAAID